MPYVAPGESLDRSFLDLDRLAAEAGPAPWRIALAGSPEMRVVLIAWPAGHATIPHRHPGAVESFTVVRGRALFTIGDEPEREVPTGGFAIAMRDVPHAIRVPDDTDLLLLATVSPNEDRPDEQIDLV